MKIFFLHVYDSIWLAVGAFMFVLYFYIGLSFVPRENFIAGNLLEKIYPSHSLWYQLYRGLLCTITGLFCILLAGPYQTLVTEKETKNGIDIEIVFDLSYSMVATDIFPNRLEVAKEVLVSFIGELSSDRVGLILFAGKPFQSIPLSYDYDFLQAFLQDIEVETINQQYKELQGTAVGDALLLAASVLFQEKNDREKIIIFITDGEANKGIDPLLALKFLKEKDIKTYTIGVGKEEKIGITLMKPSGGFEKLLVSGVDEEILKKIAQETGGLYFKADSKTTFQEVFTTITHLEKKELVRENYTIEKSLVPVFASCIISLYLCLLFLLCFKKIRL